MNLLFAAQSGWGKSYHSQAWLEKNIPEYDVSVILDYKDEYRGLVKHGLCKYVIAGPEELRKWGVRHYTALLDQNQHIVLVRHDRLNGEDWQQVAARVIAAARRMKKSALIAIDEAHFVAPQRGKVHEQIIGLATTGRGENVSSVWISQRLSEMEETVISQCQARILGGFESSADLSKVAKIVEYPEKLHNPQAGKVQKAPEELQPLDDSGTQAKGGLVPALRKFEDDEGNTIGSEWIYSDNSGDRRRLNTQHVTMESTHYGAQGKRLEPPEYQ